MKHLLSGLILLFAVSLTAQTGTITSNYGNLTIEWDGAIKRFVEKAESEKCTDIDESPPVSEYCSGNRVQLFYSKDRKQAEDVLKQAKSYFPEIIVNLDYISPEYKVKAGYFSSRESAQSTLNKARKKFPLALITGEKFRCSLMN